MTIRTRNSIESIWGDRTPFQGEWPSRVDEHLNEPPDHWVQSVCPLCSNGCGLDIGVKDGRIVGVRGRAEDRVNHGRLGPKGMHGWIANHSPDRLTRPLIRVGRKSASNGVKFDAQFREASWDEALNLIVQRSREIQTQFSGNAIGIYNTGQLFIEEYYTLGLIANAGLRTHQLDGNTRLCTATAGNARWETFGAAITPGTYQDVDVTDCLFLVGHNVANTQTVLWMRMLDRLDGPNPPKLIVVDPRDTHTAQRADVHLAPKPGTNVALLNGLLHLIIEAGQTDREFIAQHTVGFEKLAKIVKEYPPERVADVTGVPVEKLRAAAAILGSTPTLVSSCLQGVYQSNQATAAAVQVNNINLVRGLIARPGCGILQMNGQPSAQNTHEAGADGDYMGFRNYKNPEHMADLARHWNVDLATLPHWGKKAHVMEIFRNAEHGSVKMLWIIATNPAVSLPEVSRIREILANDDLFVVVSDAFMTETAQLADVILPAAIWGEKTGVMTNADRTAHISHKAIDPPGEARSDFDIFLDYARRMDFRDRDGQPLVKWSTPEEAFDAFKLATKGRPCDYSGMSYAKLSGGSGIQWPCNEEHPEGTERMCTDLVFPTHPDVCQTYGHDIETGAHVTKQEYEALNPAGRAILKGAHYRPPIESPDAEYPFWLTTFRNVYHFQTRTKTGRSQELHDAAPDAVVQLHPADAQRHGINEGDMVEVRTRRGTLRAPAQIGDIQEGTIAVPYHYGYWDEREGRLRAADELTLSAWDPVSKQPYYKFAAAHVSRAGATPLGERALDLASKAAHHAKEMMERAVTRNPAPRSHVPDYLSLALASNQQLAEACETVSKRYLGMLEIRHGLSLMASFSQETDAQLRPFSAKYGEQGDRQPEKLRDVLTGTVRAGDFGLLRDLHGLWVQASDVGLTLKVVERAARALADRELTLVCEQARERNHRQVRWLETHVGHIAPHVLTIPQ